MLLVFFSPAFLGFLLAPLIPLFRLNAWRRLPAVPTAARPAYLPPLPERWPPASLAEVTLALDARARAIVAQRHMAGVDVLPPDQLRLVLTEPLLATWVVLRLPPAALGAPYQRHLPTAPARASAMRSVRALHGALASGADRVPLPVRLHHALLLLDRLAHAGAAAVPAEKVEAALRG